jgi:uncharacterized protein (DUF952 family)
VTEPIVHITSAASWAAAKLAGVYLADSLTSAGFIHCSRVDQIIRVANNFYSGRSDLVILKLNPSLLTSLVRWEPGADKADELFPHLYGPLNLEAVVGVYDFPPGADGKFGLPRALVPASS